MRIFFTPPAAAVTRPSFCERPTAKDWICRPATLRSSITATRWCCRMCAGAIRPQGMFDALNQEGPDGYDTINWIAGQPWSDGKVGMIGGSYLGIAQWRVALLNNPHLKAIFPVVSGSDDYFDRFYSTGGATKLGHRLLWFSENLNAPRHAEGEIRATTSVICRCARPTARPRIRRSELLSDHSGPPDLRFVLEADEHSREHRSRTRAGVSGGRMVRQLRGRRSGGLLARCKSSRRSPMQSTGF